MRSVYDMMGTSQRRDSAAREHVHSFFQVTTESQKNEAEVVAELTRSCLRSRLLAAALLSTALFNAFKPFSPVFRSFLEFLESRLDSFPGAIIQLWCPGPEPLGRPVSLERPRCSLFSCCGEASFTTELPHQGINAASDEHML